MPAAQTSSALHDCCHSAFAANRAFPRFVAGSGWFLHSICRQNCWDKQMLQTNSLPSQQSQQDYRHAIAKPGPFQKWAQWLKIYRSPHLGSALGQAFFDH